MSNPIIIRAATPTAVEPTNNPTDTGADLMAAQTPPQDDRGPRLVGTPDVVCQVNLASCIARKVDGSDAQ